MMDKLPKPETMLTYASILEKQQYVVHNKVRYPIPTGEIIEAACDALRACAAIKMAIDAELLMSKPNFLK